MKSFNQFISEGIKREARILASRIKHGEYMSALERDANIVRRTVSLGKNTTSPEGVETLITQMNNAADRSKALRDAHARAYAKNARRVNKTPRDDNNGHF
jgi:hypothetical protein